MASNLHCINRICQWYDTEHLVLAPRRSEGEGQLDLDPEQLTRIVQKERNMAQARGESMPKLIANRETLIHRASELEQCARTVVNGQLIITHGKPRNSQSS